MQLVILAPIKTSVYSGILLFLMYKLLNFNGINLVIFYIYNLYVINFPYLEIINSKGVFFR